MRKIIMSLALVMLLTTSVFAQTINVNGKSIQVESKNINGITLVPLRVLAETMGADVGFNDGIIEIYYKTGFEKLDGNVASVRIIINTLSNEVERSRDRYETFLGGEAQTYTTGATMPHDVIVDNGVSYIPFRFVAESLAYEIDYKDGAINLTKMTSGDPLKSKSRY